MSDFGLFIDQVFTQTTATTMDVLPLNEPGYFILVIGIAYPHAHTAIHNKLALVHRS
jgi:hypothetical protein